MTTGLKKKVVETAGSIGYTELKNRADVFEHQEMISAVEMPPRHKLVRIMKKMMGKDEDWQDACSRHWESHFTAVYRAAPGLLQGMVGDPCSGLSHASVYRPLTGLPELEDVHVHIERQVSTTAHWAILEFLGIDYDHPIFEMLRLGVVIVEMPECYRVYGKDACLLGEMSKDLEIRNNHLPSKEVE